jgi:hypothetical protein
MGGKPTAASRFLTLCLTYNGSVTLSSFLSFLPLVFINAHCHESQRHGGAMYTKEEVKKEGVWIDQEESFFIFSYRRFPSADFTTTSTRTTYDAKPDLSNSFVHHIRTTPDEDLLSIACYAPSLV